MLWQCGKGNELAILLYWEFPQYRLIPQLAKAPTQLLQLLQVGQDTTGPRPARGPFPTRETAKVAQFLPLLGQMLLWYSWVTVSIPK